MNGVRMREVDVIYYCEMVNTREGIKTPKFVIKRHSGGYGPIMSLCSENKKSGERVIAFYLKDRRKASNGRPQMFLQSVKSGLNLSGLKFLFDVDRKLTRFAYGEPLASEFFTKRLKRNPFYGCSGVGFLFVIHQEDEGCAVPTSIEMLVLGGARGMAGIYCKQLAMGGFDEDLRELRRNAVEWE